MEIPRILVADDEQTILNAYKKTLGSDEKTTQQTTRLIHLEKKLFKEPDKNKYKQIFDVELVSQGESAVEAVKNSLTHNKPFSVVFLDVRMPPGPDGVWTAKQIRDLDPLVNIVIVTAFSNISPAQITAQVSPAHRILYMQKPFHSHEIRQFATALSAKWQTEHKLISTNSNLDKLVKERTSELKLAINALETSNKRYKETTLSLHKTESELARKADDLEGTNLALQQLIKKNKQSNKETEQKILFALHEMIEPYLDSLEKSSLDDYQRSFVKIIKSNLQDISEPFKKNLSHRFFKLNPTEIQIANLIKQGFSTKKIVDELDMNKRTVDFNRDRIREKIGIKNTKANLKKVLNDLEGEFDTN